MGEKHFFLLLFVSLKKRLIFFNDIGLGFFLDTCLYSILKFSILRVFNFCLVYVLNCYQLVYCVYLGVSNFSIEKFGLNWFDFLRCKSIGYWRWSTFFSFLIVVGQVIGGSLSELKMIKFFWFIIQKIPE